MLRSLIKRAYGSAHLEQQYLDMVGDIISGDNCEKGRNGDVVASVGGSMYFDLSNGTIPLLTSKKVAWKTCLKELLWFIKGSTSNTLLKEQNVHIWDANASREFLDSRGLLSRQVDDLGPVYGHQWRYFNASYDTCDTDYTGKGVDQLANVINALKDPSERSSRRIIMSAWNPNQLDEMALPPCHILAQFNVLQRNKLSCSLYQRSCDMGLGVPFNIASYSFLTHLLAKHCNLEADSFFYHMGNCHVYSDHVEPLSQQILRKPLPFPTVNIKIQKQSIEDYIVSDFELSNYEFHPPVIMKMRQ